MKLLILDLVIVVEGNYNKILRNNIQYLPISFGITHNKEIVSFPQAYQINGDFLCQSLHGLHEPWWGTLISLSTHVNYSIINSNGRRSFSSL